MRSSARDPQPLSGLKLGQGMVEQQMAADVQPERTEV
jgi:hypothetical protein